MIAPSKLWLEQVIARLEREDPARIVPVGFGHPHSYRGDYFELAFEIKENVSIDSMLDDAKLALGTTYQGWKGGDYTMHSYTEVWLVREEGELGETLGAVLLELMLSDGLAKEEAA